MGARLGSQITEATAVEPLDCLLEGQNPIRLCIGDLLLKVKQTFGEVIVPSLTEPFAVGQGTFITLALEHIVARWDQAQTFHRAENSDLRQLLADTAEELWTINRGHPELCALLEGILQRVAAEDAADRLPRTSEAIAQANAAMRKYVRRLLEYVEGENEADHFPDARSVVRACRAYMRRQLERERAWVAPASSSGNAGTHADDC